MKECHAEWTGTQISGVFTLLWPTPMIAENDHNYYRIKLEDGCQVYPAHIWQNRCKVDDKDIIHGEKYFISGRHKAINGSIYIDVLAIDYLFPVTDSLLLPRDLCPVKGLLERLGKLLQLLTHDPLILFVQNVMKNEEIMRKLLTCPASIGFHHNYVGGLLEHSIECSESVASEPNISDVEKQIGIVAALFHDLGKIRCFSRELKFSSVTPNTHDVYTPYLLAPYLAELEMVWPDGAELLMYLLDWIRSGKNNSPVISVAIALKKADEISCSQFNARQAFVGQPAWKKLSSQNSRKFFRLAQCA